MANNVKLSSLISISCFFYDMINMVIKMQNAFDNEIKYKLFRTIREILHPTISKKNISDYKIIIDESILPVRIFYPKKVTGIDKIIIYIHGNPNVTNCNGNYSNICKKLSIKTNRLVIAPEYKERKHKVEDVYKEIYNTIKYIYIRLEENGINPENIALVGDSTGGNIITGINYLNKQEIPIKKEVLFYPTLSLEYFDKSKFLSISKNVGFNLTLQNSLKDYFSYIAYKKDLKKELLNPLDHSNNIIPDTLIIVGKVDCLIDECAEYYKKLKKGNHKYLELPFSSHGFLKKMDSETEKEVLEEVNNFL